MQEKMNYSYYVNENRYYVTLNWTVPNRVLDARLDDVTIVDESGEVLDEQHDDYSEIYEDALTREYETDSYNDDSNFSHSELDDMFKEDKLF